MDICIYYNGLYVQSITTFDISNSNSLNLNKLPQIKYNIIQTIDNYTVIGAYIHVRVYVKSTMIEYSITFRSHL